MNQAPQETHARKKRKASPPAIGVRQWTERLAKEREL